MADASIPVDLFNPGQVFACLGFLETADVLLGGAEGGFDWTDGANVRFHLRASGKESPFASVLDFLSKAKVSSRTPAQARRSTEKWGVPAIEIGDDMPFPFPEPTSPATLPAVLEGKTGATLMIDHWGDATNRTSRDNVKFWAGSGGYPGAALARDALDLVRQHIADAVSDPFSLAAPQSSSFRFDWRRDYIPINVGFSPNDHKEMTMVGFPIVELLAAIGLGNARPKRAHKLEYRYSVIGVTAVAEVVSPMFLRAALGGARLPFLQRDFRMRLGWPGKENQARCITDVIEEENL